jgi:hypothetical protein
MSRSIWLRALTLLPPLVIFLFLSWVWYAYALVLIPYRIRYLRTPVQTTVHAVIFHLLWLLDVISLVATVFRGPGFVKRSQASLLGRAIRNEQLEGEVQAPLLLQNPYKVKGKNAFVLDGSGSESGGEDEGEGDGEEDEGIQLREALMETEEVVQGREAFLMAKDNGDARFCRKVSRRTGAISRDHH